MVALARAGTVFYTECTDGKRSLAATRIGWGQPIVLHSVMGTRHMQRSYLRTALAPAKGAAAALRRGTILPTLESWTLALLSQVAELGHWCSGLGRVGANNDGAEYPLD
jgi:hypothetical protein